MPFINTLGTFSFPGKFLTEPQIGSNFWLPIKEGASPSSLIQNKFVVTGTPFMFQDNFDNANFFTGGSTNSYIGGGTIRNPSIIRVPPDGVIHPTISFGATSSNPVYQSISITQMDAVYANGHFYVAGIILLPKSATNPTRIIYDCSLEIIKYSIVNDVSWFNPRYTQVWTKEYFIGNDLELSQLPRYISIGYDQINSTVYASTERLAQRDPVTVVLRDNDGSIANAFGERLTRQVVGVIDEGVNSVYGGNRIYNLNVIQNITGAKSVTMTYNSTPVSDYKIFDGVAYGFHENILFRHDPVSTSVTAFAYTLAGSPLNIDNLFVSQTAIYFTSGNKVIKLNNNLTYVDGYQNTAMSSPTFVYSANGRVITIDESDVFSIPDNFLFPGTGQYSYTPPSGVTRVATLTKLGAVARSQVTISKTIQSTTIPNTVSDFEVNRASMIMGAVTDQLEYKAI